MKRLTFSLAFAFCLFTLAGAQTVMHFEQGTLEDALSKAQSQNKLVFVDAFTDWCGPCKMMAKKVFTDASVAEFFNANFINYQLDMEKGDGPSFAQIYAVNAYPTLLFLKSNGALHEKVVGARQANDFLELGKKMADPKSETLASMHKKIMAGDHDPDRLRKYIFANHEAGNDIDTVFRMYQPLMQGESLLEQENWDIFLITRDYYLQPEFQYVYMNRERFIAKYGKDEVNNHLGGALESSAYYLLDQLKFDAFDSVVTMIAGLDMSGARRSVMSLEAQKCVARNDWPCFRDQMKAYLKEFDTEASSFNNAAFFLANNTESKKDLSLCLKWIDRAIELEENGYTLDSKAFILHKMGKKEEAIKFAETAIAIGQSEGIDMSATKDMLRSWKEE